MIGVRVKLFGTLRPLLPPDAHEGVWSTILPPGTRAADALTRVGVPPEQLETLVILVNGRRAVADTILQQDDTLSAFPAVAGG